jgi:hypothetical protein
MQSRAADLPVQTILVESSVAEFITAILQLLQREGRLVVYISRIVN